MEITVEYWNRLMAKNPRSALKQVNLLHEFWDLYQLGGPRFQSLESTKHLLRRKQAEKAKKRPKKTFEQLVEEAVQEIHVEHEERIPQENIVVSGPDPAAETSSSSEEL